MIESADHLAKETFESQEKMESFLLTLSKMYNISCSNILLLKNQKNNVSFVADKEKFEKYKIHVKDNEKPLKAIKKIKVENKVKFKVDEVYDISQTDAIRKQEKVLSKKYIETMIKGMCLRRGFTFDPNNLMLNLENIITDINKNIVRPSNVARYNVDLYASQTQAEVNATVFSVAKKLNINTKNYNLKDICKWGIDKDSRTLKESLICIQRCTNYFIGDFQAQKMLYDIENEKRLEEEME